MAFTRLAQLPERLGPAAGFEFGQMPTTSRDPASCVNRNAPALRQTLFFGTTELSGHRFNETDPGCSRNDPIQGEPGRCQERRILSLASLASPGRKRQHLKVEQLTPRRLIATREDVLDQNQPSPSRIAARQFLRITRARWSSQSWTTFLSK